MSLVTSAEVGGGSCYHVRVLSRRENMIKSCAIPTGELQIKQLRQEHIRSRYKERAFQLPNEAYYEHVFLKGGEIPAILEQLKLVRVRPGEREGRGRTGSPLRPVGTRLGAASDGASIWGFGKLRAEGPGTQSGVVGGLGYIAHA